MQKLAGFILFVGLTIGSGCQAASIETSTPFGALPSQTAEIIAPTQGDAQMTPAQITPQPGLQNLIEKAKTDLANRLGKTPGEIVLVEASSVVWPDSSLGCPQKGMAYAQVLTPGYLIRLNANNTEYEYHASRGTEVIYCENPAPPVQGTPGDI